MKILIVDDSAKIRRTLKSLLADSETEFVECEDGAEALAAYQTHQPDVVLMDLVMPGMDGIQLCDLIRKRPDTHHTPVLILSARNDADSVMRGMEAGADDYLPKPILHHDLVAKVRHMLAQAESSERT